MSGFLDMLHSHLDKSVDTSLPKPEASETGVTPYQASENAGHEDNNSKKSEDKGPSVGQRIGAGLANAFGNAGAVMGGSKFAPAVAKPYVAPPPAPVAAVGGGTTVTPQQAAAITAPMANTPAPQVQLTPPAALPPPTFQQYQLGQQAPVYSDENLKTNIEPTSMKDINEFLKSVKKPKNFDYKNPKHGTHTKGGLIAQNLEKSKIGKEVVINTPQGKMIDSAKLAPILAAVMGSKVQELDAKINKALNDRFKKGKK